MLWLTCLQHTRYARGKKVDGGRHNSLEYTCGVASCSSLRYAKFTEGKMFAQGIGTLIGTGDKECTVDTAASNVEH